MSDYKLTATGLRPVALKFTLTPEQTHRINTLTGRQVTELQLTDADVVWLAGECGGGGSRQKPDGSAAGNVRKFSVKP